MPPQYEAKAKERIKKGLIKYSDILKQAGQRGVNEADTSNIVQRMLDEILGYDPFSEITGQYEVRGRWADWAVKVKDCFHFFVEVKPLGTKLREKDLFQVVSYSRQHNLEWAILSTGDVWQCHRVAGGKDSEEFFEIRMLDPIQSIDEKVGFFYLLAKEGYSRGALHEHWAQAECFRPERLVKLLLSDEVMSSLRRVVRNDSPGRRVEVEDLREALIRGVVRGDLSEAATSFIRATPVPKKKKEVISEQTRETLAVPEYNNAIAQEQIQEFSHVNSPEDTLTAN